MFRKGDLLDLLPMLHNIKELHLRFNYGHDLDSKDGLPQFAPTPLNHLRVLEVFHPDILSWFETPSLCGLYFVNYRKDKPLDVHEQISSLIQRSGCQIRKLSFESCKKIHVGTLKDVEELEICSENQTRSSIDISSLPKLRFLTIIGVVHQDIEQW
ncbi:hypothetical protein M378DRAFT_858448 [Amanita muscaria Koide BX008]|uniref:Uncharacterized protein n=1 Tax=Amanita muscaria (strain Koide BX008) TaxID=946122 RepID=A0A0C2WYB0_AMAMK|nr:hypothetical protein M378DRAFT_858448 [Amanita muscaria Koide BX008]